MPRIPRIDISDTPYHIINRANGRQKIFSTEKDYQAFEAVLKEAKEKYDMRILAYCIMPNHWHLVLYPRCDGDVSRFMQWLTLTHTQRYNTAHNLVGYGHLYQGRYKSFLVQESEYLLQLCRYVERNPLRAKMVKKAEDWKWSSMKHRENNTHFLAEIPVEFPRNYLAWVNTPQPHEENLLMNIRHSLEKGKPFGSPQWTSDVVKKFKLETCLRGRGRPRKGT